MTDDNNNKKPIPRRLYFAVAAVKTTLKKKFTVPGDLEGHMCV